MLHKRAASLPVFIASDGCQLSEVIHPQNDGTTWGVSLARASLPPGRATRPHVLDFAEIYYVLAGQGVMHLEQESAPLGPDSCLYLPPGARQWVQNTSPDQPLVFLCICHPAYDPAGDRPA
ncbi:MAG: cupin domain-containing protein [Desulfarculus sp.]|jgi:mannose-6-phosphate isomerase-like protein (cupin superfamily)|nr:MAG: cupin domain-containing protein [Desulfarculus sp.]